MGRLDDIHQGMNARVTHLQENGVGTGRRYHEVGSLVENLDARSEAAYWDPVGHVNLLGGDIHEHKRRGEA